MTDLPASASDLDHILSRLERTASFADLMAESARGQSVRLDRKSTTPTAEPYFRGAVVRAWAGTRWVEAATTDLSAVGLSAAADSVERAVQGNPSKAPPPGTSSTVIGEQLSTPARPVADLGVDGMIRLCRDVQAWALEVPAVKDATIGVGWQEDERLYRNTVGAR